MPYMTGQIMNILTSLPLSTECLTTIITNMATITMKMKTMHSLKPMIKMQSIARIMTRVLSKVVGRMEVVFP